MIDFVMIYMVLIGKMIMKDSELREQLINLIKQQLELNIANCKFMKRLYRGNKSTIKVLNKSIKESTKALVVVHQIKHIELLRAIYADIIGKYSAVLMLGGTYISSKALFHIDNDEKAFNEFMENQKIEQEQAIKKAKERQEYAQAVEKARQDGKRVEFVVDPATNKVKPVIVDEGNA